MSLADAMLEDFEMAQLEAFNSGDLGILEEVGENDLNAMEVEYSLDKPVSQIAKLRESDKLREIMDKIREFTNKGRKTNDIALESDPEYQLIVKSNDLISEIDNETSVIHKYVKDIYVTRYPELSTVVTDPVEYLRSVKTFGNNIKDVSKHTNQLGEFLTSATIMVVSVTASTSTGTELTETRLHNIIDACDMAIDLQNCKKFILQFVESRMPFFAPNLSTILGSSVAAKLIGQAGGLSALAKTPACNLLNFGSAKKSDAGVVMNTQTLRGCGFIYFSEQVQKLPPDLRKKAAKLYANKAVMAARLDMQPARREENRGTGVRFLQQIEKQIEKWQEPPPVKPIKPLPAPIDIPSKKRGGRRHRKMKERTGMTELRKSANRMEFGGIEESYENEISVNAGRLGKTSRVRAQIVDAKTNARVSKSLNQKLQRQNQAQNQIIWGGTTTVRKIAGNATTVAFTPLTGVEISNPVPIENKNEAGLKYFSSTSNWVQLKK